MGIVYRLEKGERLTNAEQDQNLRTLWEAIEAVSTGSGSGGLALIESDDITGVVTFLSTENVELGRVQLPARPVRPRGTWLAGVQYLISDVVRVPAVVVPFGQTGTPRTGGVYISTVQHVSNADVAVDIASGKLVLLVADGRPAQTRKGTYEDLATYEPGDVVFYGPTGTYYQMFGSAPAGSKPDRVLFDPEAGTVSVPWGAVSYPQYRKLDLDIVLAKPAVSAVYVRQVVDRFGQFSANLSNASPAGDGTVGPMPVVKAKTAATAAAVLRVMKNGTQCGSISFAAGATNATFSTTGGEAVTLEPGDLIEVLAPTSQDAALANVYGFLTLQTF